MLDFGWQLENSVFNLGSGLKIQSRPLAFSLPRKSLSAVIDFDVPLRPYR